MATPVRRSQQEHTDQRPGRPTQKRGIALSLRNHALVGLSASLLISLIEWIDLNLQGAQVFSSAVERLIYPAYLSLNLIGGLVLGSLVGITAILGSLLIGNIERMLGVRGRARPWAKFAVYIGVSGLAAILLKQQPHINGYVIGLIREAEKLPSLNEFLLSHERSVSYLTLTALVIGCSLMRRITLDSRSFPSWLRKLWIAGLCMLIAAAYYVDSRVEVLQYQYSLHRSLFLLNVTLAMSLTGTLLISSASFRPIRNLSGPVVRNIAAVFGAIVLIALVIFTLVHFDSNQDLKVKTLLRTTQTRQYFSLVKWTLDFDRDGYSAFLGGGDADDSNIEINPGRPETMGDGIDNDCIGGDLTQQDVDNWRRERVASRLLPDGAAKKLNIIYIFVDALRADHLGAYGYHRNISPNIDRLAARSVVFENAYSPAPNTYEALPRFMQASYWDGHYPTWTEVLKENGYNNLLFPRRVSTQKRHIRGMKLVQEGKSEGIAKTIDLALDILEKAPTDQPYCAYLYSTDPHFPYLEHAGFKFGPSLVDAYDGEIAYADSQFGRLFDWLEASGRLSNTMIVIMADHGESLGERGVFRHSSQLYDEQLRIPMIMYVPGIQPRRVSAFVNSIDLGPTILNTVGVESPKQYAGVSLIPLMRGDTFTHPPIFAEQSSSEDSPFVRPEQNVHPDNRQYMIITQDGYKLIYNRNHYLFQLFDLNADRKELDNLYDRDPHRAAAMKALLGRFIDIVLISRPWDADESKNTFGRSADEDSEM